MMDVPVHDQDPEEGGDSFPVTPGHLPPGGGQGLDPWSLYAGAFIVDGRTLGPWGKHWVAGLWVLSES